MKTRTSQYISKRKLNNSLYFNFLNSLHSCNAASPKPGKENNKFIIVC